MALNHLGLSPKIPIALVSQKKMGYNVHDSNEPGVKEQIKIVCWQADFYLRLNIGRSP